MDLRAGVVAALAGAVLLLAAFVTTTSDGALWSWSDRTVEGREPPAACPPAGTPDPPPGCAREAAGDATSTWRTYEVPAWFSGTGYVLLAGMAAFLVAVLVRRIAVARRRRLLEGGPPRVTPPPSRVDAVADPEALAGELELRLAALREGTPRNAIVATWVELERAAEHAGFHRDVAETPSEFTRRVLASYVLDERAIRTLARLYREARFSEHQLTEAHRAQARECLLRLYAGLRAAAGGRQPG